MPHSPALLIYLAVIAAAWIASLLLRRWRAGSKRSLGDADAYEGNLIIPLAAGNRRQHTGHPWHDAGHASHDAGHVTPGGHGGVHHQ